MDNLDELIRRQFERDNPELRFPFREDHWEQAQAMLEAEEDKRKKRRRFIFWWWTACTGLLLLAGSGMWWYRTQTTRPSSDTPAVTQSAPAQGDRAATTLAPSYENGVSHEKTTVNNSISNNYTQPNAAGNHQNTPAPGTVPTTRTNKQDHHAWAEKNADANTPKGSAGNRRRAQRLNAPNAASTGAASPSPGTTGRSADTPAETPAAAGTTAPGAPNQATATAPAVPAPADPTAPAQARRRATPDQLPHVKKPVVPTTPPDRPLPAPPPTPRLDIVKTIKKQVWVPSAEAGATLYTADWMKQPVSGYAALYLGRRLSHGFTAGIGLQARWMPLASLLDTVQEPDVVQLRYSFGYTSRLYYYTPKYSLQTEVPLTLAWERGPWSAEAGVALGYRAAVYGEKKLEESTSFHLDGPDTLVLGRMVWLPGGDVRPWHVSGQLGGGYTFRPGWSVRARVYYRRQSLYLQGPDSQTAPGILGLEAGLRFSF